jgi:arsenite/tail-anchored protein-transporting ATPase
VPPRTILHTGKGGVGKTSVAAATARAAAARGLRTLVLSTDPAHSLADVLGVAVGDRPTEVGPLLHAQQVDAQAELERHWGAVRAWAGGLLADRGVERISAEELTVPPGLDELFSLLAIKEHVESEAFDVLVVDCAPTGETLRLLSFPEVARWWLERVAPQRGRLLDAARPLARQLLDVPLPSDAVLEDVQRLGRNLIAMNEVLRDHEAVSIRLVLTPDRMVVGEARRTFTYLNLYGFLTDAVIVNRVFPEEADGYFAGWRDAQRERLAEAESSFAPVPVLRAPWFDEEVVGPAMLDRLAATLFAGVEPTAVLHDRVSQELVVGRDRATLRLELPFVGRDDITLKKHGLELVVRVGGHKRTIALPPALADYAAAGAAFDDGALTVTFDGPARP